MLKKLHHTNIVIGGDCSEFVFEILEKKLNFNVKANPDFLLIENETFGIGDVRDFGKWVIGKPLLGEIKVSLIIVKSITHEAQNALLKVLEEPPLGTYIFINLENLGNLTQTLLSRARIINPPSFQKISNEKVLTQGGEFLKSSIKSKFSMIKKDNKDQMKELIKNLEVSANQNNLPYQKLKPILKAKVLVSARGASPKMILEWLACML